MSHAHNSHPAVKTALVVVIFLFIVVAGLSFFNIINLAQLYSYLPSWLVDQGDQTLLVEVNGKRVYLSDVKVAAGYSRTTPMKDTDKTRLQQTLDRLTEESLLDAEAAAKGIAVSDQELKERADASSVASGSAKPSASVLSAFKYQLLKDKVMAKNVKSVEAYLIGIWTPSPDYQGLTAAEKSKFASQLTVGKKAMAELEERLKNNGDPYLSTKLIYDKYPEIQPILGINGKIYEKTADGTLLKKPVVYTYKKELAGKPTYDAIFSLPAGGVKLITENQGTTINIVKVVSVNNVGYDNYQDWLKAKTSELVKVYNTI